MSDIVLNDVLYGADKTERVVAVEAGDETVTLYIRNADDTVTTQERAFSPWLITDREYNLTGAKLDILSSPDTSLVSDGYRYRYRFRSWKSFLDARRNLREQHAGVIQYGSAIRQFLMDTGITLFKGMTFDNVYRMQIDIETTTLDPNANHARIFLIAISDNRGYADALVGDEGEILVSLINILQTRDPDVIEGHNFYGFDLPYLLARCKYWGIPPAFGRNRAPATTGLERNCAIGANTRSFVPVYIRGRHIIDTYLAVQRFDIARAQLSSYGLKECAQVYGFAVPDRVYLDRTEILEIYKRDPDRVRKYALQDVQETASLASLVVPTEFYQTQIVPEAFQTVAVSGSGEKINAVICREYLRQGIVIPKQKPPKSYPGGYTDVLLTGVIKPIVKADVESLYPSLMLVNNIAPADDKLGIFLPLLRELTQRRLDAKGKVKVAHEKGNWDGFGVDYWDGLQNSFKILINSFYGYIGGPFFFNDYDAARRVTETGQNVVKQIAKELEKAGSHVIEIDTDGVYFQPPSDIDTREKEIDYVAQIGDCLPNGIRLAHDGSYAAMLSLKMKNYVLVGYDGKKIYKGSALRSRSDERYGRRFLSEAIDCLLHDRPDDAGKLYKQMMEQIENGQMPVDMLARRERITDKMINSELRKRAGTAIKGTGLAQGDFVSLYQRKDRSLALLEEYAHDEDTEHYAGKLYKFACRLRGAVPEEQFDIVFPKPVPVNKRPDPNQLTMDLFG